MLEPVIPFGNIAYNSCWEANKLIGGTKQFLQGANNSLRETSCKMCRIISVIRARDDCVLEIIPSRMRCKGKPLSYSQQYSVPPNQNNSETLRFCLSIHGLRPLDFMLLVFLNLSLINYMVTPTINWK